MKRKSSESDPEKPTTSGVTGISNQPNSGGASMAHEKSSQKRVGKRPGRKPSKIDQKAKLERSRQSARECRARKKLRYQYLEELVSSREKAVFSLREEVEMYKRWSVDLDRGIIPDGLLKLLAQEEMQKPLTLQNSPQSQSSTPTASPSSLDTEAVVAHPGPHPSAQCGRLTGSVPVTPGQSALLPGRALQTQQAEQSRRQQLTRQTNVQQTGQHLSSMNKGSRSFEESSRSSSSSSSSATAPTMYRSGSVPNLTAPSSQPRAFSDPVSSSPSSSSSTLMYSEFNRDSSTDLRSTGFMPELTVLSKVVGDSDMASNIPTVVSHRSPPAPVTTGQPGAALTWVPPHSSSGCGASQGRTYPFTCAAGSMPQTPHSAHITSQAFRGGVCSTGSSVSPVPNFLVSSSGSVNTGSVASSAVPYYQRPRSSSDLARKVTPSAVSSSLSLSQQNLPGLFDPAVTTAYSSQSMHPTLADSVTTCLTNSTVLQETTPVCIGSDLSASISEPIPLWYNILDDLESLASLSARQGAFSDAGTPGSSRARSGAGTPSSVDSPYSQQLLQQPQQAQQLQDSGNDGNIPNIISDFLGQPPSS
ncbi:uncharacterized protein LOC143291092 isoform X2 [Babylonia areolata]